MEITKVYGGRASVMFHPVKHYYVVEVPSLGFRETQPSVTTVLKMKDKSPQLMRWAVNCMQDDVKKSFANSNPLDVFSVSEVLSAVDYAKDASTRAKIEAAEIGTLVHRSLEQHLKHLAGEGAAPTLPLKSDHTLAPHLTPGMIEQANAAVKAGLKFFNEHEIKPIAIEQPRWSPTFGYIGTCDLIALVDGIPTVLDYKTGKKLYPEVFLQLAAYQKAYEEEFGQALSRRIAVNVGRDGALETKERGNDTLKDDFMAFRALLAVWRWNKANDDYYGPPKPLPRVLGPLEAVCA